MHHPYWHSLYTDVSAFFVLWRKNGRQEEARQEAGRLGKESGRPGGRKSEGGLQKGNKGEVRRRKRTRTRPGGETGLERKHKMYAHSFW